MLCQAYMTDFQCHADALTLMRANEVFRTSTGPDCVRAWEEGVLLALLEEIGVVNHGAMLLGSSE